MIITLRDPFQRHMYLSIFVIFLLMNIRSVVHKKDEGGGAHGRK